MSEADSSRELVTIHSGTQERLGGGIRVAAGNFWKDRYPAAGGEEVEGLTCALWISASDASPVEHRRVHPGERLKLGTLDVVVSEITESDVRLSLR